MKFWIVRRLSLFLFVLWGITTIVFIIMNAVPRNPAIAMAGSWATPEQIEQFNKQWGLDKPVWERYVLFYFHLFHLDLGKSIRTERPVITEIKNYYPATFELATFSILFSFFIGIPLGIISAIKRGKALDQLTRFISLVGVSTPIFWSGLILLLFFYYIIGFVNPGRVTSIEYIPERITGFFILDSIISLNWKTLINSIKHLILPSFSLGFFGIGFVSRITRSSMIDVLNKDFIKVAMSKGLSYTKIIFRHAIKNALIPVITIIGFIYGKYLAGVIPVEVVFSWPGLGTFVYNSILKADHPAILGSVLFIAFSFCIINLVVDILYRYIDPRIKFR